MADDARPGADRMAAAQARSAGLTRAADTPTGPELWPKLLGGTGGVEAERCVPARAQLRAKLTERDGQQVYHLSGVASVTDVPYEMWDFFGPYEEIVAREAFDETLAANPDVAFLLNHRGMTMARTTAGTLELGMVDEGLGSDAYVNPKRQDVKDLVIAIEDGHIDQMSFAFMLEEGWWSDDFMTFKITKVNLDRGDVSAVNYGANPHTSIAARSREILADLDRLPAGVARAAMARLSVRSDLATAPTVEPLPVLAETQATHVALEPAAPVATEPVVPAPTPEPAPAPPAGGSVSLYEQLLTL